MAQLWNKGYSVRQEILEFTVGNDYQLDQLMIPYDCYGSIAHAAMLAKIGILTPTEYKKTQRALVQIIQRWQHGEFHVKLEDEDGHTAIENDLTKTLGTLGKKIHTARSRNDQVVTMTRLYTKEQLLLLSAQILKLVDVFLHQAKRYEFAPMPGYTHMQRAMPTSVGTWFDQYAEALLDDLRFLQTAYDYNDMSPLGSAAGFGVNIPIDRQYTSKLLGFSRVQNNPMYVSYTRGKVEVSVVFALNQIMNTLAKFANDVLLFSMSETGFIQLPKEFCTGSSLMPQKRNGDVFELTRAKAKLMQGQLVSLLELTANLPSGYNRDTQLSKDLLVRSFETCRNTVVIMAAVIQELTIDTQKCLAACSPEVFATDQALNLVQHGMPFREAYRHVAAHLDELEQIDPLRNIKSKRHVGATGNLGLALIRRQWQKQKRWLSQHQRRWDRVVSKLLRS